MGERLTASDALTLHAQAPTHALGRLADAVRARSILGASSPTSSIATSTTRTSASRGATSARSIVRSAPARATSSPSMRFRKIDETIAVGGNQLLLQGGHNPDIPLACSEDLFRSVKARYPEFSCTPCRLEVIHISRLSHLPVPEVISRLVAAGPRQRARRRCRDSGRSCPHAAPLLRQGHRR